MRIVSILICLSLLACSRKENVTREELIRYVNEKENGLIKRVEKGDLVLEALYKPTELILSQELINTSLAESEIDSMRQSMEKYHYLNLRIARNDLDVTLAYREDSKRYNAILSYLTFGIAQDLLLIDDQDTVQAEQVMYVPSYSGKSTDLVIVFKNNDTSCHSVQLYLNDKFLGTGITEFVFKESDLKRVPTLSL
jgi:hypothetical protein